MAINLGSAYAKVDMDASGLRKGIDGAVKGLKTLGDTALTINDKIRKVADGMQRIGAGMSLALTLPILAFAKSAVKEAARGEAAMTDLNAVIKSTGGIAGVTAKNVEDYANKMQLLTKFSDDEIISGDAMLLTFTKIGKDIFPAASDATLDMAQKFGMDLPQAAITLGKALNDPISGVTALRRIGVMLTDQQEKSIKAFMDVNDIASAQKIILDELAVEVGGVATAYGTTFAGQVAIFNHRIDDMKEKIGMQLIPALIRFMDSAKPLLDWFANASPATIDLIIKLAGLIAIAGPLSTAIGTLGKVFLFFSAGGGGASIVTFITTSLLPALTSLFTFITATAIPAIVAFVVANAAWLIPLALVAGAVYLLYLAFKNNFGGITDTIVKLHYIMDFYFKKMADTIATSFRNLPDNLNVVWQRISDSSRTALLSIKVPIDNVTRFIRYMWNALLQFMKGDTEFALEYIQEAFFSFGIDIFTPIDNAARFIRYMWNAFLQFLKGDTEFALEYIQEAFFSFGIDIFKPLDNAIARLKTIWNNMVMMLIQGAQRARDWVVNTFKSMNWSDLGKNIIWGLANGLLLGIPNLILAATKAGQAALAAIKKTLGIASDSKEFMKLGVFSGQGYQAGLVRAMDPNLIARTMARPVQNMSSSNSSSNIFHLSSGLSIRDVDRLMDEKINRFAGQLTKAMA